MAVSHGKRLGSVANESVLFLPCPFQTGLFFFGHDSYLFHSFLVPI